MLAVAGAWAEAEAGAGAEGEEKLAFLHRLAVLEVDALEEAAGPGADIDMLAGLKAAHELVPVGDVLF